MFHKSLLLLSCFLGLSPAFAGFTGSEETKSIHFLIVPGQNGLGGQRAVQNHILNPSSEAQVTYVETPQSKIDLGQKTCMEFLDEAVQPKIIANNVEKVIIHASSQGTATTLNYVAQNPEKVAAIILEAVLASGNSCKAQL